jgi:hydroxymethylbilane synthase
LLQTRHPGLIVDQVIVDTKGDQIGDVPLDRIGGQGVFVKEVQLAVMEDRADAAVHSAKDLPTATPVELVVGAVPERADPRDALVGCSMADLPPGAVIATGSARRRAQLANWRPDLTFVELRGNMATRLARAGDGSVHAVVVAMAALERLEWTDRATEILSPTRLLPQVGQGAIAAEYRRDRPEVGAMLDAVDHPTSHLALDTERAFLAALGGGCTAPVAGWAEVEAGGSIRIRGMVASPDGRVMVSTELSGDDPRSLGAALAEQLLERCGGVSVAETLGWGASIDPAQSAARHVP